jgi:cytochrome c556
VATEPLFVANRATLIARLRLTGSPSVSDAAQIIDQAIEEVRLGFYDRLGSVRVNELEGFTYAENPEDPEELTRARANACEIIWCRLLLMQRMPQMFIDGSANINQIWNDEAAFRAQGKVLASEIEELQGQVDAMLEILLGTETQEVRVKATILEPDQPSDLPGASIFPRRRRQFGSQFPDYAGQCPDGVT